MKRFFYYLLTSAVVLAVYSCKQDPELSIKASFTTDKETYEVGDVIVITNTSSATNTQIALNKWEYQGNISYDETLKGLYFEEAGQYTIKLTVTAEMGSLKDSFEKVIVVEDNNVKPVADFSYEPTEVAAGEPIQFTDLSTDEDGTITKWEWTFGTSTSSERNPVYTFSQQGSVSVSLTVTDDKYGKSTKTISIDVQKGAVSLDLAWSKSYDDTTDAYAWGTSPAVSHDGEYVYVTSTGYDLVCFTKSGERKWAFDIGKDGASAKGGINGTDASIKNPTPTPSVDTDGTVFAAAGYNYEASSSAYSGFLYAVTGGATGGTQKWVTAADPKAHMTFFTPTITDNYVMMAYRNGTVPNGNSHLQVRSKEDGSFVFGGHCNSGSRGGLLATKSGKIIVGSGDRWGYRLFFPDDATSGKWNWSAGNSTGSNTFNLGYNNESTGSKHGTPYSNQPAAGPGGKIYLLFKNIAPNSQHYLASPPAESDAVVTYYENIDAIAYQSDSNADAATLMPAPTWMCAIKGSFVNTNSGESGNGIAVAEDGTVYAATCKSADGSINAYLTAINASGTIKWEHKADGNIEGVPAIDNDGYVYYNDALTGDLVMLDPANGKVVASISLGDELRTSPTVSYDGTIYVTGMKGGKPTLFAVKGEATGCSASWSQLGGNPSKTGCMY